MPLDVTAAAARLGVTPSRVRMLIHDGRLAAERVGNAYLIDEESMEAILTHERPAHTRAFSRRTAWACAALTDGVRPTWVGATETSRLRSRLSEPGATLEQWVARMRSRAATTVRLRAHEGQLTRLLADASAWRSSTSAKSLVGDAPVESGRAAVWVAGRSDFNTLRRRYGLLPSSAPNVIIRAADVDGLTALGAGNSDAFRLIVAADLLDDLDARARRSGRELLEATLLERRWEQSNF